jgi:hypothetical protein
MYILYVAIINSLIPRAQYNKINITANNNSFVIHYYIYLLIDIMLKYFVLFKKNHL